MTRRSSRRYEKTQGRGYRATTTHVPDSSPTRPSTPPTPGFEPKVTYVPEDLPPKRPAATPGFEPLPRPTTSFIPKGDIPEFHPPGPGIGLRPGPAPALGRPGILPKDHGAWKNKSCFSRGSKNWKPGIKSLHTSHICPGTKGPQSPFRPPNVSGDPEGYNSAIFNSVDSLIDALHFIGYRSSDANAMVRMFQKNWNRVSAEISMYPGRYDSLSFQLLPEGTLRVDGEPGPNTLNALEVAAANQDSGLNWAELVRELSLPGTRYGRKKAYNAAEGL